MGETDKMVTYDHYIWGNFSFLLLLQRFVSYTENQLMTNSSNEGAIN